MGLIPKLIAQVLDYLSKACVTLSLDLASPMVLGHFW
jgi:hypothetical protein